MAQEINEMNIEKLREEVNPVYSTAHSCLQLVAATGDEDSENLRKVLGLYRGAESKGNITGICVDMKNLEYISSAGLRVLLIMRKALAGDSDFSLINMSDQVKEIIETTGFDTIFC